MNAGLKLDRVLFGFGILVFGVAALGAFFTPGTWYLELKKPTGTPPNWLFGPVWTLLYLMIAVAGSIVFRRKDRRDLLQLWGLQLVLNGAWSWLFFGEQAMTIALADIALLLVTIVVFVIRARSEFPLAAKLMIPYGVWVSYATYLNAGLLILN